MSETPQQSFSCIQSRRVLGNLQGLALCPSMDLCVYHTSASADLPLYRTMSWERVATIRQEEKDTSIAHQQQQLLSSAGPCCRWSPSGKWIAVAIQDQVQLYGVEPLANPPEGYASASEATQVQYSLAVSDSVTGLYWAHVGRAHPTAWNRSENEMEEELSWRYQSHYVDSMPFFLPPSGYLVPNEEDDHHRHQEQTTTTALPESKTPLSVLCISTKSTVDLYLHGRYRLMQLSSGVIEPSQVTMSHDLSFLMVASKNNPQLALYHLPFLKEDRYALQVVASLHASITAHLATLQQTLVECANSWKTSLKPLDMKLQPLGRLLANYGVDELPLGVILKQYILVGHTSESSNIANAIDQFFTGIQMNDQLLQRMERSLHSALANVEGQVRKGLLSPSQALCYQVQELAGHIRVHDRLGQNKKSLQDLVNASHQLWISVQSVLLSIVQGRLHIRDFCGWLRSAGSQIKARGTALNSVQRENAKKRRVPQAVLERLLSTINTAPPEAGVSFSEHLLDIKTSRLLKDSEDMIPLPTAQSSTLKRSESPSSVLGLETATPTIPGATRMVEEAFEKALNNPLSNIPEKISCQSITLPSCHSMALHMRIGADEMEYDPLNEVDGDVEDSPKTYFLPEAAASESDEVIACHRRQWSVVATTTERSIQLYAIPLGDATTEDEATSETKKENNTIEYYLTAMLNLPGSAGLIRDVGFYSDDGKSSLSSGTDSGTGKEGRQKLGVLYQHDNELSLWLIEYDNIRWQSLQFDGSLVESSMVHDFAKWEIRALSEEQLDEEGVLQAQTRRIVGIEQSDVVCKLMLCGSRGVGGVAVASDGVSSIELLDLEEDDEEEDDDEEFDEEE